MKVYKLSKYAEDGVLTDVEDAEFLARKIGNENKLDFSGIISVSSAFLDHLLSGQTLDSIDGRISGQTDEVDLELVAWIDRQEEVPSEKTTQRKPATKKAKKKKAAKIEYVRPELAGERYTPTRLVARLRQQLTSYIESAYPLNDPILVKSRRIMLEEAHDGHLLAQEPYVETTPRYKEFDGGYNDLGLAPRIAGFFSKLSTVNQYLSLPNEEKPLVYPRMYQHQAESFRQFFNNEKDIIVSTGTGSGKTECFMMPILGSIYDEACSKPESFQKPGVRVLVLYPMNALVNDQLSRLRLLFGDPGIAEAFHEIGQGTRHPLFGMYTGRTPYPGPRSAGKDADRVKPLLEYYTAMDDELRMELKRRGRYPAKDLDQFYARELEETGIYKTGKNQGKSYTKHHWKRRLHTGSSDSELLTRQEMVKGTGSMPGNAPDILITNYSMLEYMLLRPFERPVFWETAEWLKGDGNQFLIVLDEAHMYRGAKGAEVGFLLRRLRARLGIHDKPEKLRIICTSASLGKGKAARKNIRNFAADLTGKKPDNFMSITGERSVPKNASPAGEDLAAILAEIDLDHLHATASPQVLAKAIGPLLEYLESPNTEKNNDEEILRHLNKTLKDKGFVNMLIKETSVEAKSLSYLADAVFPASPSAVKAMEVLITLGAIARTNKDEPGLVPARVHIMFRGMNAIFGCINPLCQGRQDKPGEPALVGKLFSEPRMNCDHCGSRVYELASCRNCGSPYFHTYYPSEDIGEMNFLWGETPGALTRVELLPSRPRYVEMAEEVRVHLKTGYVDLKNKFPEKETRSLWVCRNQENDRQAKFARCPMCQPGSRMKSRISSFRTKGEQPFTALIEAQFSEQPPQKDNACLPNRGRKVLVFSDGRQKAARLAPALEHSHSRDLFRQVIAIAADTLQKHPKCKGMHFLYPAMLWVCKEKGVNIFPLPDEEIFHGHLRDAQGKDLDELIQDLNQGFLQPTLAYAKHLFSEMTDRYYALNALGIATVEEDPLLTSVIFRNFPEVGLHQEDMEILFRSWLRQQLEARRFLPQGADIYQMGEGWEKPVGIDINNPIHVIPKQFREYLLFLLKDEAAVNEVVAWFVEHVRASRLLGLHNDHYFLQPLGMHLRLRLDDQWQRCDDCGRLHTETIDQVCSFCLGRVGTVGDEYLDSRTGFYRQQILSAFDEKGLEPFGLVSAEHSAQLTGKDDQSAFNKTEKYELRFQDIAVENEPPIDVLSCTTTMEVGIDIGTLSGVALRNVPPHVANYQQRAGRAGRRGRSIASVITYAHGTSHDSHYYDNPNLIITGEVEAPVVYVENQQVLRRHINAYLVQRFFHETVQTGTKTYQLFEALGTVEQFLTDSFECSFNKLISWLKTNEVLLKREIEMWAPQFSFGLNENIEKQVRETVEESVSFLVGRLDEVLPVDEFKHRDDLEGLVRESLERQLEEKLLECLIGRAILPRYAFPTDVVGFWVSEYRFPGTPAYKRAFKYEPQRDLQIALSEFAPGSSLTIDKYRFHSAGLYSPYAPEVAVTLEKAASYTACTECGYVSLKEESQMLVNCPCCRSEQLARHRFIRPEGFAPDINIKPEIDRGEAPVWAGMSTRAQIEVQEPPSKWDETLFDGRLALIAKAQDLVTVNKGVGDRGFMVCPECGLTEPVFGENYPKSVMLKGGVPTRHHNPLEQGVTCDGHAVGPYFLGHQFPTDVLLIQIKQKSPFVCTSTGANGPQTGRAGRAALTSLVEAICLSASRTLQIEEGELSGNWSPVLGEKSSDAQMFLYDLLPGGAGYTRLVKQRLTEVLDETEKLLAGCDCETSCYSCLRHYGNNFYHTSLDRKLAYALLRFIKYGESPELQPEEKEKAMTPILDLLKIQEVEAYQGMERNGLQIPLVIRREDESEIWVDIHHPLVNPDAIVSQVRDQAEAEMVEFFSLDTFTLSHDLPSVFESLQI
jgi:ATP-dependent helicase YprA (DUF1998 family)